MYIQTHGTPTTETTMSNDRIRIAGEAASHLKFEGVTDPAEIKAYCVEQFGKFEGEKVSFVVASMILFDD